MKILIIDEDNIYEGAQDKSIEDLAIHDLKVELYTVSSVDRLIVAKDGMFKIMKERENNELFNLILTYEEIQAYI